MLVVRVEGKPVVGQEVDDAWGRDRRVGHRSGQQEWLPQRFGNEGPHCPGKVREGSVVPKASSPLRRKEKALVIYTSSTIWCSALRVLSP